MPVGRALQQAFRVLSPERGDSETCQFVQQRVTSSLALGSYLLRSLNSTVVCTLLPILTRNFYMRQLLLLVAGLVTLPLVSTAQTAPISSTTPFYLGLGASTLSSAPASSYHSLPQLGPALSAGLQLTSRWELQAGAALNWRKESDAQSYEPSPGQAPTQYVYTIRATTLTVPLLARYTLTSPAARLGGDVLGGVMLLHTAAHFTSSSTTVGQPPYVAEEHSNLTRGNFSLGLAARFVLLPQLELTADGLANVTVTNSFYQFKDRLFLNLGAGVRYHFGP